MGGEEESNFPSQKKKNKKTNKQKKKTFEFREDVLKLVAFACKIQQAGLVVFKKVSQSTEKVREHLLCTGFTFAK